MLLPDSPDFLFLRLQCLCLAGTLSLIIPWICAIMPSVPWPSGFPQHLHWLWFSSDHLQWLWSSPVILCSSLLSCLQLGWKLFLFLASEIWGGVKRVKRQWKCLRVNHSHVLARSMYVRSGCMDCRAGLVLHGFFSAVSRASRTSYCFHPCCQDHSLLTLIFFKTPSCLYNVVSIPIWHSRDRTV